MRNKGGPRRRRKMEYRYCTKYIHQILHTYDALVDTAQDKGGRDVRLVYYYFDYLLNTETARTWLAVPTYCMYIHTSSLESSMAESRVIPMQGRPAQAKHRSEETPSGHGIYVYTRPSSVVSNCSSSMHATNALRECAESRRKEARENGIANEILCTWIRRGRTTPLGQARLRHALLLRFSFFLFYRVPLFFCFTVGLH